MAKKIALPKLFPCRFPSESENLPVMNVPNRTVAPSTGPRRCRRTLPALAAVSGLLLALPVLHEGELKAFSSGT